jgi:hypothetical protein
MKIPPLPLKRTLPMRTELVHPSLFPKLHPCRKLCLLMQKWRRINRFLLEKGPDRLTFKQF